MVVISHLQSLYTAHTHLILPCSGDTFSYGNRQKDGVEARERCKGIHNNTRSISFRTLGIVLGFSSFEYVCMQEVMTWQFRFQELGGKLCQQE